MQEFFQNTLQSKLIKNILINTPLPIYDTVREGDYILQSFVYINRCNIHKCIKSGRFGEDGRTTIIGHYDLGEYYPKYTYRFNSSTLYYDIDTHRNLGNYLRALRGCLNIDLMPFYNCWCNEYLSDYLITSETILKRDASAYKTAIIPIKFNKNYTVALDSSSVVSIAPIFLENNVLIKGWSGSDLIDLTSELCARNNNQNVIRKYSTSFKRPFTVMIQNKESDSHSFVMQRNEKYLYLAIQVPRTTESTLVVLEGDYTNTGCFNIFNMNKENRISPPVFDKLMISKLDLLQLSTKKQRPYSDRLLEYLLDNVITPRDDVKRNVVIAQQGRTFVTGIWDNTTRAKLYYTYARDKRGRKLDNVGYVDKDVERSIMKGYI